MILYLGVSIQRQKFRDRPLVNLAFLDEAVHPKIRGIRTCVDNQKMQKEMLTLGVEPRISSLLVMRFTTKPCELIGGRTGRNWLYKIGDC